MRNPIFADTTTFLDHAPDGTLRRVSGNETGVLSDGARIIRLETRQPLVEITSTSGFSFCMSPESAFALHKDDDGRLLRYSPVEIAPEPLLDWLGELDDLTLRRYALAGMIIGNGVHLFSRYRASYTVVPDLDMAFEMQSFLTRLSSKYLAEGVIHLNSNTVQCLEVPAGFMLRSRSVTILVGNLIAEKTLTPTFFPSMLSKSEFRAFLFGLLSTAPRENGSIVVRHRNADTIRTLGEQLYFQFGVPCDIHVDPMEPRLQRSASGPNSHRIRLSAEQQNYAVLAGLLRGTGKEVPVFQRDTIETIVPLPKKVPSVIVLPGSGERRGPLTANGFAFRAEFQIPVGIAEIASHPALLKDSSDPATFEDMT